MLAKREITKFAWDILEHLRAEYFAGYIPASNRVAYTTLSQTERDENRTGKKLTVALK